MKVESTFVVDGSIVKEVYRNGEIIIYETQDNETLYIVSNSTFDVLTRIDINCEMSQGMGFVDNIVYTDFSED